MMNCNDVRDNLSDYIEGELTGDLRGEVEQHLTICQECKETEQRIRFLREGLRKLPRVQTSPDFEYRLHQRLSRFHRRTPLDFTPLRQMDWKVPAFGSAVLFVAFLFVFMLNSESGNPNGNSPTESGLTPSTLTIPQQQSTAPGISNLSSEPGSASDRDSAHVTGNKPSRREPQLIYKKADDE